MNEKKKQDQKLDTLNNMTPEELQVHIKEQKKKIRRSLRLAFTAFIAIIAIGIAWFVNNTKVNVSGIQIAATNSIKFELATVGNSKVIDTRRYPLENFITEIGGMIGEDFVVDDKNGTVTNAAKSSIQWNMSADHYFANVQESALKDETDDEIIGLQPGTSGKLEFYIIPKVDGEQTINFTLSLTPYVESMKKSGLVTTKDQPISIDGQKSVWEVTNENVKKILKGHIYFFENQEKGLYTSWMQPDADGTLQFSVHLPEDSKKDTPQIVTLYWNWPILISQVLLKEGDEYLGARKQIFSEEAQEKIVTAMSQPELDYTDFFFISAKNEKVTVEKNTIKKIHERSWNESAESFTKEEYSEINQLYNNADQFLGKTVSYVVLELTATN